MHSTTWGDNVSRNQLHVTKLEDFKEWLTSQGIQHRQAKGDWQVLQVAIGGGQWAGVYCRLDMPEHYTVDRRLDGLVRKFCNSRR